MKGSSINNAYCSTVSAVLVDTYGEPMYTCLSDSTYPGTHSLRDCACKKKGIASHIQESSPWALLNESQLIPFGKLGDCDTDHLRTKSTRQTRAFPRQQQDTPQEAHGSVSSSPFFPAFIHRTGGQSNQRLYWRRFRMMLGGVGGFVVGGILFGPLGAMAGALIGVLLARKANVQDDTNEDQADIAYQQMMLMVQPSYPYRF